MSFQSLVAKSAAVRVDFPDGSRKAYLSGLSRQGRQAIYGTAEAVPFVKILFPIWLKTSSTL